jgi:replicative DNA helicase
MINDLTLLKVFSVREHYENYIEQLNLDILEWEIRDVLIGYKLYFDSNDKQVIDFTNFFTWFAHVYKPNMPEPTYKVFQLLIERIPQTDDAVAESIVKKFYELETSEKIKECLEKEFNNDELISILNEHNSSTERVEVDSGYVPNDLTAILQMTDRKSGLNWRLDCLNECIGPLNKGQLIIVGAYVDVGKTIFGISEAAYMATQLTQPGECIMWLNNEEQDLRVQEKIWKSVLDTDAINLRTYPQDAQTAYTKVMGGELERIRFINIRNKTLAGIHRDVKLHAPKLIVIDQVDKIVNTGRKSFSDHDRLKSLYGEVRAIANEFCSVIAISQADSSTVYRDQESGDMMYQLYPHHRQLDGSKVGKPGEADAIIMIGRDHRQNNTRGLHVSKNKFGNTMKKEVIFDGSHARYLNPTEGVKHEQEDRDQEA